MVAVRPFLRTLACSLLLMIAVSGTGTVLAQSVNAKKKELDQLRNSIKETQQQLDRLARDEAKRRSSMSSYQRQQHQVSRFITALEDTLARLRDSASAVRTQIQNTQGALAQAEQAYQQTSKSMLRYVARRRGVPQSDLAKEAVFQSLTRALGVYRARMSRLQDSLAAAESVLSLYTSTQESVLQTHSRQQRILQSAIARNAAELKTLRSNSSALRKQLSAKQRSVARLRSTIERLVAEARRKEEARRAAKNKATTKSSGSARGPSAATAGSGGSGKGFPRKSLPWPTASRSILNGYGSYKNPETGTTLDNPGVDIKTKTGSAVQSVAPGTVSSVQWLPGFNSLVIIDHGNGVRTVYANLASVSVASGSTVQQGSVLGTTGENIDGELLHFEVWNGRERQNPLTYLR
ncbi:MAG: murein hydrolase activator EnvC family protein [Candidatus Kapaibacteriota bacterium]